jgi:hypothetical protein
MVAMLGISADLSYEVKPAQDRTKEVRDKQSRAIIETNQYRMDR